MGFLDIFKRKKNKDDDTHQEFIDSSMTNDSRESEITKVETIPDKETSQQEDKTIKKAFLAIFSTEWCGVSKLFIKEIQDAGIHDFTIIDVEKDEDMGEKYEIRAVPTTILFDQNGNTIKRWFGYDDKDPGQTNFVQFIKSTTYPIFPFEQMHGDNIKKESVIIQEKFKEEEQKDHILYDDSQQSNSISVFANAFISNTCVLNGRKV